MTGWKKMMKGQKKMTEKTKKDDERTKKDDERTKKDDERTEKDEECTKKDDERGKKEHWDSSKNMRVLDHRGGYNSAHNKWMQCKTSSPTTLWQRFPSESGAVNGVDERDWSIETADEERINREAHAALHYSFVLWPGEGSDPVRLEVEMTLASFTQQGKLKKTTFKKYTIITV